MTDPKNTAHYCRSAQISIHYWSTFIMYYFRLVTTTFYISSEANRYLPNIACCYVVQSVTCYQAFGLSALIQGKGYLLQLHPHIHYLTSAPTIHTLVGQHNTATPDSPLGLETSETSSGWKSYTTNELSSQSVILMKICFLSWLSLMHNLFPNMFWFLYFLIWMDSPTILIKLIILIYM